jgi:hypothetical protein
VFTAGDFMDERPLPRPSCWRPWNRRRG